MNHLVCAGGTGQEMAAAVLRLCYLSGLDVPKMTIFDTDVGERPVELTRIQVLLELQERLIKYGSQSEQFLTIVNPTKTGTAQTAIENVEHVFYHAGGLSTDERDLIDLMFNDKQQKTTITNGFHGEPAVGSMVFSNALNKKVFDKFMRELDRAANETGGLDLVFAGSLMGGVGTAVIPVLVRELARWRSHHTDKEIRIMAALQAPWFNLVTVEGNSLTEVPDVSRDMMDRNSACLIRGYLEQIVARDMDGVLILGLPHPVPRISYGGDRQLETLHYLCLISGINALNLLSRQGTEEIFGRSGGGFRGQTISVDPPKDVWGGDPNAPRVILNGGRALTIRNLVDITRGLCAVTEALLFELECSDPVSSHHDSVATILRAFDRGVEVAEFESTLKGLHNVHIELREWLLKTTESKVGNERADTLQAFRSQVENQRNVFDHSAGAVTRLVRRRAFPGIGRQLLRAIGPLEVGREVMKGSEVAWDVVRQARDKLLERLASAQQS